jgi:arsenate reductase (glutaredoxin)
MTLGKHYNSSFRSPPNVRTIPLHMLTIYTLANCDTCRAATKWLRSRHIAFEERAIRETPPTAAELRDMLAAHDGELRRLFNTAGRDYREQKLGEKLPTLTTSAALALLAANGNLVKRPFLTGDGVALVGFNEKAWTHALAQ